jgi:vacuolar-type H+-ATPase subunit E/Vma4
VTLFLKSLGEGLKKCASTEELEDWKSKFLKEFLDSGSQKPLGKVVATAE